jgi:hypothetical protein
MVCKLIGLIPAHNKRGTGMAASIHELKPVRAKILAETTDKIVLALADPQLDLQLPEGEISRVIAALQKHTVSKSGWTFVMISPEQNALVVQWLAANSKRPIVAMRMWAELFSHMRTDTGEIVLRRTEIADKLAVHEDQISEIMGELEAFGAISRKREKVAGLRGPGFVRYFMNPRVGTHLSGAARDKAQAEAPLLKIMEGGLQTA